VLAQRSQDARQFYCAAQLVAEILDMLLVSALTAQEQRVNAFLQSVAQGKKDKGQQGDHQPDEPGIVCSDAPAEDQAQSANQQNVAGHHEEGQHGVEDAAPEQVLRPQPSRAQTVRHPIEELAEALGLGHGSKSPAQSNSCKSLQDFVEAAPTPPKDGHGSPSRKNFHHRLALMQEV